MDELEFKIEMLKGKTFENPTTKEQYFCINDSRSVTRFCARKGDCVEEIEDYILISIDQLIEYIDWDKVKKDTKVLVSDYNDEPKKTRYFCDYLPNAEYKFATYSDGSKKENAKSVTTWKYCKLAEEE